MSMDKIEMSDDEVIVAIKANIQELNDVLEIAAKRNIHVMLTGSNRQMEFCPVERVEVKLGNVYKDMNPPVIFVPK